MVSIITVIVTMAQHRLQRRAMKQYRNAFDHQWARGVRGIEDYLFDSNDEILF